MRGVLTLGLVFRDFRARLGTSNRKIAAIPQRILAGTVLGALFAMTGCIGVTGSPAKTDPPPGGSPTISVTPSSINFGDETVGSTAAQAMQIANNGNADLTITQVTATGAGFNYTNFTLPTTVAAGQSASLTVDFKPSGAGSASGSLSIASNAVASPLTVSLSGVGQSSNQGNPGISASPSSIGFGSVVVGSTVTTPLTLTNTGTANLTISNLTESESHG